MELKESQIGMLELILRPGFCVKDNLITEANSMAKALLLTEGTDVRTILATGKEEYASFEGGCLYLKLALSSRGCGATVVRSGDCDVFILDQDSDDAELQVLALAAQQLREPLTSIMICAERLAPNASGEHVARLNRGLHQMLRIIGNMSDAGRCAAVSRQETQNIGDIFAEVFSKAQALLEHTGISLSFQNLTKEVLCLCDTEQLERAVLNMLSNSVKFTPKGGTIDAKLTLRGRMLQLTVVDSGSGIAEAVRSSVFSRYLRQPGIEDSRYGLGLGLVMIRSAAANHGGTVLIDQPKGKGTRITMTMAIRQDQDNLLRSPVMRVDYSGERDHGLIELSECLPLHLYEKE